MNEKRSEPVPLSYVSPKAAVKRSRIHGRDGNRCVHCHFSLALQRGKPAFARCLPACHPPDPLEQDLGGPMTQFTLRLTW